MCLSQFRVLMLVKLVSWNLRYSKAPDEPHKKWKIRRPLIFTHLTQISANLAPQDESVALPDFFCVQEALSDQCSDLEAQFSEYVRFGLFREDGLRKGESCSIFYLKKKWLVQDFGTFWLSDTPEVPGSITWGNACTRICTWGIFSSQECKVAVFNTHLDHVSEEANLKAVSLIAEKVKSVERVDCIFVTGDMNFGKDSQVVQNLLNGAGLKDTFDDSNCADESFSYHAFAGDENEFKDAPRIDFILYKLGNQTKKRVTCLKSFQWRESEFNEKLKQKVYPSDHYAVCSLVEVSEEVF